MNLEYPTDAEWVALEAELKSFELPKFFLIDKAPEIFRDERFFHIPKDTHFVFMHDFDRWPTEIAKLDVAHTGWRFTGIYPFSGFSVCFGIWVNERDYCIINN